MELADLPQWARTVAIGGVVAGAVVAIAGATVKVVRVVRTMTRWLAETVRHEVTEIVDARLAPLLAEFRPNGGGSIKDQVTRIEAKLDAHLDEAGPLIDEAHRRWDDDG